MEHIGKEDLFKDFYQLIRIKLYSIIQFANAEDIFYLLKYFQNGHKLNEVRF